MASLKDEEQATNNRQNNNNSSSSNNNNNHNTSNNNNNISSSTSNVSLNNNNNNVDAAGKRESLEARKQALEQRLSEKSWLLQQIQKQETAIMHGNYEHLTVNEFFAQLAQQYKHEQQLQALAKESGALLRRKQSTTSRSESQLAGSHNNINNNGSSNNNRHSETHSNRSSEYDNYQPSGSVVGDMLVIGVAQQQSQQHPHVKSALKKRPTPTPTAQMQYAAQAAQLRQPKQQQQHLLQQHLHMEAYAQQHAAYQQHQQQHQQLSQTDVISMYSANSSNVATLRQQHVAPQQQPIIVQCDKYYLSPTHQSYNEGGFIKSSQNIKKYVSPLASPSAISYEQSSLQHQQHQRQLDAISLAPSYMSVEVESVQQQQQQLHHQQQQQYRWRSQSHIAALTPPHPHQNQSVAMSGEPKSHSSDMLAAPMPRFNSKPKPLDEISLCSNTISEKKPKPKQWLESSLDGPAVVRQIESTAHSPVSSSSGSAAGGAAKPRTKLSSQSMSVSGRHYSMSAQRSAHNTHFAHAGFAAGGAGSSKGLQHADERFAKLSQSTSYLNAMEQTMGISASYPLEPLDIPPFRHLPPKPNHSQQPTPPPRPPPVANPIVGPKNLAGGSALQNALVSPPLSVVTATASGSLSPDIRIESPKNMTVVQQATFQPYKEETKPFEMSDFYKYSTKFKQKEGGRPE